MSELKRIDPENCGCTDCILGYSKPINHCTQGDLYFLREGKLDNASNCIVNIEIKFSYEYE